MTAATVASSTVARDAVRQIAAARHPDAPTYQTAATVETPDLAIRPGDIVVYVPRNGAAIDGQAVVALDDGKLIFGRAVPAGDKAWVGDTLCAWHMIRGIIVAVIKSPARE